MSPTSRAAAACPLAILALTAGLMLLIAAPAYAQEAPPAQAQDEIKALVKSLMEHTTKGPESVALGTVATLKIPKGFRFVDPAGTVIWNRITHNTGGAELGILRPPEDQGEWFITFDFQDIGYVKDDETLDNATIDNILKSIKDGTEKSNAERRANGWETMTVVGWDQRPFYDPATHHLTWAIRGRASDGSESVNYDSRVLGRSGVMRVKLVDDPGTIAQTVPTFNNLLTGISFNSGQNYSEYRSGDKIAEYGLVGLISGGAAVAAVKFWKPLMKVGAFIVAGIAAVFAKIKRAFSRKKA